MVDVGKVSVTVLQAGDLMAHIFVNAVDNAREALFQEAIKAADNELDCLI